MYWNLDQKWYICADNLVVYPQNWKNLSKRKLPWAAKILMMVQIFIVGTFQKWSPVDVNWQGGGGGWSPSLTLKTFLAGEATMMMMMMMIGGGGDDDDMY